MSTQWAIFGDKSRFAFEYRFLPDPDGGKAATRLESASWGAFRIWVRNKNLCQHYLRGTGLQETTWYLAPLLRWLAENWDPLFHEERFPLPCDKSTARMAYVDSFRRYLGDTDPAVEAKGEAWFGWWQRHALRSCRQGGVFPDIFFRRLVDFTEISWGNFHLEGVGEDLYFTVPQGAVNLPVEQVAKPLLEGMMAAVSQLTERMAPDADLAALAARVAAITAPGRLSGRLNWYTGIIARVGGAVQALVKEIVAPEEGSGFIRRLSPAVAMFGSLTPEIGEKDLERLIHSYIVAHQGAGESDRLRQLISREPHFPDRDDPYDAGYDAALDLLDALDGEMPATAWIDVRTVCQELAILVKEVALDDSNIRGVAFAGESVTPTILINTAHLRNKQEEGLRFSIGHELCHILHDRLFGAEVSIASGPWAPANIEKRANAFAAMLLMPLDRVNQLIGAMEDALDSSKGITDLANRLLVSRSALVWHLYNLNKIDESQRSRLFYELNAA